jgi:hypothetical protein
VVKACTQSVTVDGWLPGWPHGQSVVRAPGTKLSTGERRATQRQREGTEPDCEGRGDAVLRAREGGEKKGEGEWSGEETRERGRERRKRSRRWSTRCGGGAEAGSLVRGHGERVGAGAGWV